MHIEKNIRNADQICDCIPIVSTLTNGAQLLWKLAHKVDKAANPVKPGWKSELKFHVVSKSKIDCVRGMVPFVGNLLNMIGCFLDRYCPDKPSLLTVLNPDLQALRQLRFILFGHREESDQKMMTAVVNDDREAIQLYLANHPLEDDPSGWKFLEQAAYGSESKTLQLLLQHREWGARAITNSLWRCSPHYKNSEEKVNILVDYYLAKKLPLCKGFWVRHDAVNAFSHFVKAGKSEAASRILEIVPPDGFDLWKRILEECTLSTKDSKVLTSEQIAKILDRCNGCLNSDLKDYCSKVVREADAENYREVQLPIIEKLMTLVPEDGADKKFMLDAISSIWSNEDLLKRFLDKWDNVLATPEDKFEAIEVIVRRFGNDITFNQRDAKEEVEVLQFIITRYHNELSEEHYLKLLGTCSRSLESYNTLLHYREQNGLVSVGLDVKRVFRDYMGVQAFFEAVPQLRQNEKVQVFERTYCKEVLDYCDRAFKAAPDLATPSVKKLYAAIESRYKECATPLIEPTLL